jgi:hypothetical protein
LLLVGASGLGAGGAAAVTVISERVSGLGGGVLGLSCLHCAPGGLQRVDQGKYVSVGQLGTGSYSMDWSVGSACGPINAGEQLNGNVSFDRSDGANLFGTLDFCEVDGSPFSVHLTGTTDLRSADLTLTIFNRGDTVVSVPADAEQSREQIGFTGTITVSRRIGYWMIDTSGRVYGFGGNDWHGNAPTPTAARDLAPSPSGNGYWVVNVAGQVYSFGDAHWLGNANRAVLAPGEQITTIAASLTGKGYWLFTTHGRVLPFGDAHFFGDLHATRLNAPIFSAAMTPTGMGYYMVGTDGGVFTFGDAKYRGSMGGRRLNAPVIAIVPTADNGGYWLVAIDGGVFAFSAPYLGSMGGTRLSASITAMDRYETGYIMVAANGSAYRFARQINFGSLATSPPANPIVDIAAVG